MKGTYRTAEGRERFTVDDGHYVGIRDDGDRVECWPDRVAALHDGWQVRGGVLGGEAVWVRGEQEHRTLADGFTGTSPGYDLALAARLRLEIGQARRVRLVEISEPVGAARTVEQSWTRVAALEEDVDRYEVVDLQTGERWLVHLSGEVLVSRDGARTAWLESLTR